MFEPFGQLIRTTQTDAPPMVSAARLTRVGIYLFWALVVVVVVARAAMAFEGHLFVFGS